MEIKLENKNSLRIWETEAGGSGTQGHLDYTVRLRSAHTMQDSVSKTK